VLSTYQDRHTYQGDACAGDITGDPGVLLSVVLQEWPALRRALPGCRHWIDLLKGFRNVWAHASGLRTPVAVAAYVVACELVERAGIPGLPALRATRDRLMRASHYEGRGRYRARAAMPMRRVSRPASEPSQG
jgi:hypothetical protein